MQRFITLLTLVLLSMLADAQSIKLDSIRLDNYNNADIVFLGEVIEIDTVKLTCSMKAYEIFKGAPPETIKFIITSGYTFIPNPEGLWIIYANKVNDTIFTVSDRSLSRNNLFPDRISFYVPDPPKRRKNKNEFQIESIERRIKALVDWNNELYKLRTRQ